ncbi:MAG: glycosyltransferase [Actinomycetota bacterium]|nr:glycosyltransferase [Actinomycetota bacterium]
MPERRPAVTVVVATHNRLPSLTTTLGILGRLPGTPPVVVVDDASDDGTAAAVEARFPEVRLIALDRNRGPSARNAGVEAATTPYVAFADDDSWWAPDALDRAATHLDRCPTIGLLAARILVGPGESVDPTCDAMRDSPLPPDPSLPGPRVLGFVACGAVVRRSAFLDAGGFPPRYAVGGEEQALALSMSSHGWDLVYADDVVAHHHPEAAGRDSDRRRRHVATNELRTTWRHRRGRGLVDGTVPVLRLAATDPAARLGVIDAVRELPWILRTRRPVTAQVEAWRRLLG